MKNILFLLSFSILPLYASEDIKKLDSQEKLELFEAYKNELIDLETFLNDVESQPTQTQQQKKFLNYNEPVLKIIALDSFIGNTERLDNRYDQSFKSNKFKNKKGKI